MTDWDKQRISLLAFAETVFLLNTGAQFVVNEHHRAICHALLKVYIGRTRRLIINIPPRYSKTELAVINFIAWSMGHKPDSEFIHASYSKRLAANNAYKCRALVMSPVYQEIFPGVKLKDDSKAKDEWRTTAGGVVYATGTEGTITGYGAGKVREEFGGALIIDDPHKAAEAESVVMRQNVIDWYQSTIESRLNSKDTPIIVIMQRLHEEDLSGWLLDGGTGEHWEHLKIPALDDQDKPLWPFKHSRDDLIRMRDVNPYVFAGQYLQEPAPREGGMIKRAWLRRYHALPPNPVRIVQSWDTAFKADQINDPSACTTWHEYQDGWYLADVFVRRMEYPALKQQVIAQAQKHQPTAILIEDKASGQSLLQDLRVATRLPLISCKPEADKITRLSAVSSLFESGQVYLPERADWLSAYESELFLFPRGKHDDQVDSTSQALSWLEARSRSNFAGHIKRVI